LSLQAPAIQRLKPFRLPADWELADVLLLGCDELVEHHQRTFTDLVAAVRGDVTLVGMVADEQRLRSARQALLEAGLPDDSVRFLILRTNTSCVRDYGPLSVRASDGAIALIDMEYPSRQDMKSRRADDLAPVHLGRILGLPVVSVPLRADGGALLTNGEGLCAASTALLADNVSRGYDRADVSRILTDCAGLRRIVFLEPLQGETTGHVDLFVCFLAADLVVVAQCDPATDAVSARRLDAAAAKLASLQTSHGPMRVRRVPMPPKRNGKWRTYTNVLLAGDKLLVPVYSNVEPSLQRQVLDIYRRLMPGRTIIGINADTLAQTGGALHCIALNLPIAALKYLDLDKPNRPGSPRNN